MGRGAERQARTLERIHRRTHLRKGRPRQPQGVQTYAVVDARGATPLLPAVGETVLRGEALRLSRASACRRWAGGPHHEPAGGRRQLGRQERVAQPPRTGRGAHAPRVRVGVLHEDRAPAAGSVHSQRSAGGRESDVARTGRRRLARIRDRRRLERIPHRHEISQRHRLTPRTRPKAPQKFL